ncbi:MAG: VIT domain-containing protein, partial [bacterium]
MSSIQKAIQLFEVQNAKGQGIQLVMQELSLAGHILPVGARIIVRHVFQSAETQPVEAVYGFGLPRDAALRKFRIEGDGFSIHSELQEVAKAVKLYEAGIQEGRLSALAREYGDGLINLSIGNLRPKEEVSVFLEVVAGVEARDEGYRFRFPFSLAPSYHRDARAAETVPGIGEIELPEDRFGDLLLPRFKKSGEDLHQIGFEITLLQPDPQGEVSSPSHTLRVRPEGQDVVRVSLARESDVPNRDLVIDVKHVTSKPMIFTGLDTQSHGQMAALIPSTCFG